MKHDLKDLRCLEDALAEARAEIERLKGEAAHMAAWAAAIAHEVNQPLSGIVTNTSTCLRMLAADAPDLEGARETARRALRDGNRAAEVVTRLRTLFSGQDRAAEAVDLNEAVRDVVARSSNDLRSAGVVARLRLAEELPPVVGDRIQLQQVIQNLLSNGVDAMRGVAGRRRHLVITTSRDGGDRVRLTVQDSGVGLEPRSADRLFDAFFTTKRHGMGIGLSVSRTIIESHRGRLWASANKGPGATFSFSIPCGLLRRHSQAALQAVPTRY